MIYLIYMNRKYLLFFLAISLTSGFIQANPVLKTMQFGGYDREYLVYTPQNLKREKADGLIVCLHGFTRTMNDFFEIYDIKHLSDSLNFIFAAPQALPEQNSSVNLQVALINLFTNDQLSLNSVWGCGLSVKASIFGVALVNEELNRDIDDVGFINEIIDNVLDEYSLPSANVFILGTSMGGYMSYKYALIHGGRLSGLISIAGSMGLAVKDMDYKNKMPVCDFHSETDEVVPYSGSIERYSAIVSLAMSKPDVLKYWTETNKTEKPITEQVQNYPLTNKVTVDKITYSHTDNEVIHYKANGASHSYFFKKENGDCMDMVEEIIKFIDSHSSGICNDIPDIEADKISFYPNPVKDNIYFETTTGTVSIFEITGKKVYSQTLSSGRADLSFLKTGIYIIRIQSGNTVIINKLIKQ